MRILVLYATTDGQTRKIARHVMTVLSGIGLGVELLNVTEAEGLDLSRYDRAVLAGSLHAGGYQPALAGFAKAHAAALNAMPTLFLAVSLSAAGDDVQDWQGLNDCLQRFLAETGWTPGYIEHVAGAFRFSEYGYFRAWAMRRIAAVKDPAVQAGQDKEYTDWAALDRVVLGWVA
ncbi:flavodoxin domain-containing protein [Fuscibacter oryzae]|uniref:Protoporphyrinogen oxidase n=1 Tax=Fuscibacter oryzae TaxID=2803939 RepID=A0A8J7MPU6_9RHOB|nr:flavodoxin domain-containing protein [Fuscibacter oryzae]MBL4927813.1 protoporphyrinogen oxidase [Fuscibacter oryzae]